MTAPTPRSTPHPSPTSQPTMPTSNQDPSETRSTFTRPGFLVAANADRGDHCGRCRDRHPQRHPSGDGSPNTSPTVATPASPALTAAPTDEPTAEECVRAARAAIRGNVLKRAGSRVAGPGHHRLPDLTNPWARRHRSERGQVLHPAFTGGDAIYGSQRDSAGSDSSMSSVWADYAVAEGTYRAVARAGLMRRGSRAFVA